MACCTNISRSKSKRKQLLAWNPTLIECKQHVAATNGPISKYITAFQHKKEEKQIPKKEVVK